MTDRAADIARRLSVFLGEKVEIRQSLGAVMSGSAARMNAPGKDLFVKWSRGAGASALRAEHQGLIALAEACFNAVPTSIAALDEDLFILVMSWVEPAPRSQAYWDDLARLLSQVHARKESRYGFGQDNYIGATIQHNGWQETWPEFFRSRRLEPQRILAQERDLWDNSWSGAFDRLLLALDDILPRDPGAALVHGDLWSGNVLVDSTGNPVLIDPAVYFGHNEVDLAMARLFGGFPDRFFAAYDEVVSPLPDAPQRVEVYNLYHILNHLNLFGRSYAGRVGQILGRF